MRNYLVLIDARDDTGCFFLPVEVAATTQAEAEALALAEAERRGCAQAIVDEVEDQGPSRAPEPAVLQVYGRSYYPTPS